MQRLEVSCAVRPIYGSFGAKGLNIKISVKICAKNQQTHKLFIQFINYIMYDISYMFRHYIAHTTSLDTTRPSINILSTAPQLNISQKSLGTLPEDGNVMPKHVADTICN
jgi:hypothetical protein